MVFISTKSKEWKARLLAIKTDQEQAVKALVEYGLDPLKIRIAHGFALDEPIPEELIRTCETHKMR